MNIIIVNPDMGPFLQQKMKNKLAAKINMSTNISVIRTKITENNFEEHLFDVYFDVFVLSMSYLWTFMANKHIFCH